MVTVNRGSAKRPAMIVAVLAALALALLFFRPHALGEALRQGLRSVAGEFASRRTSSSTGVFGTGAAARRSPPIFRAGLGMTRSSSLTPVAYREYRAQRDSPNPRRAIEFLQAESRDAEWAEAMEKKLEGRFTKEVLALLGLPSLSLDRLECRSTSCLIDVSWTQADVDVAKIQPDAGKYGSDPLGYLSVRTGQLAKLASRVRPTNGEQVLPGTYFVRLRPDGRFVATTVLLFGDEDIDPEAYSEAVERSRQRVMAK
jgi:hypothetical protein